MEKQSWILCPICNSKTRIKVRKDTELINFPLFCPKCKHETLININRGIIKIIKEPHAKTQSQQFVRITLADYWLFLNPASCKADQQDSLWEKENEKPICFPFPYIS